MGTSPLNGVAQRGTVMKWYAKIEHYCSIFTVTEGNPKMLSIQEEVANIMEEDTPLTSVVEIALPFLKKLQNIFTDASDK